MPICCLLLKCPFIRQKLTTRLTCSHVKKGQKNDHLFGRSDSVDQAMVQMVRYMTSNPDCALPWPFKCGNAPERYRHGKIPANPTTAPQKLTTIQPYMPPYSSALDTKSPIAEGHQARQKCNMIKQVHVIHNIYNYEMFTMIVVSSMMFTGYVGML